MPAPCVAQPTAARSLLALLAQDVLLLLRLLGLLELRLLLAGLLLLGEGLGLHLLGLHLVDGLNEHTLVLVGVTLGVAVEVVVDVLVDLLLLAVLPQQAPKDTLPAHPQNLRGHPRLPGAAALAEAHVAALPLRGQVL